MVGCNGRRAVDGKRRWAANEWWQPMLGGRGRKAVDGGRRWLMDSEWRSTVGGGRLVEGDDKWQEAATGKWTAIGGGPSRRERRAADGRRQWPAARNNKRQETVASRWAAMDVEWETD